MLNYVVGFIGVTVVGFYVQYLVKKRKETRNKNLSQKEVKLTNTKKTIKKNVEKTYLTNAKKTILNFEKKIYKQELEKNLPDYNKVFSFWCVWCDYEKNPDSGLQTFRRESGIPLPLIFKYNEAFFLSNQVTRTDEIKEKGLNGVLVQDVLFQPPHRFYWRMLTEKRDENTRKNILNYYSQFLFDLQEHKKQTIQALSGSEMQPQGEISELEEFTIGDIKKFYRDIAEMVKEFENNHKPVLTKGGFLQLTQPNYKTILQSNKKQSSRKGRHAVQPPRVWLNPNGYVLNAWGFGFFAKFSKKGLSIILWN